VLEEAVLGSEIPEEMLPSLRRFVRATDRDQRQLHAAVAPVLASLDAETRSYVASIERLREALGAPVEPAASCARGPESTQGAIPNGTYENTMTRKDGRRARIPLDDPFYLDLPIRHKLVLTGRNYVIGLPWPNRLLHRHGEAAADLVVVRRSDLEVHRSAVPRRRLLRRHVRATLDEDRLRGRTRMTLVERVRWASAAQGRRERR
jgi:hypothetical protein